MLTRIRGAPPVPARVFDLGTDRDSRGCRKTRFGADAGHPHVPILAVPAIGGSEPKRTDKSGLRSTPAGGHLQGNAQRRKYGLDAIGAERPGGVG